MSRRLAYPMIVLWWALGACGPEPQEEPEPEEEPDEFACLAIEESQRLNGGIELDEPCYELGGALLVTHGELSVAPGTTVTIDGIVTVKTALTVGPGTTFIFREGGGLDIDGGLLRADGSAEPENPIRFLGAHHVPGYWRGLRFANTPAPAFNRLVNVEIAHGGGELWIERKSSTKANLFVDEGGRVEINDSAVLDSGHHGISNMGGEIAGCENIYFDNIERHSAYAEEGSQTCF